MTKDFCYYCKAEATKRIPLEKHHVFGKVNSEMCVFACLNCHNLITKEQNALSPKMRSENADEIVRKAYAIISGGAHLKKYGGGQIKIGKQIMEWFEKNGHNVRKGIHKKTE